MTFSQLKRRMWIALLALALVLGGGTFGYWVVGLSPLDALYQTVTTVSTVGFRELFPRTAGPEVFTIILILMGVGTVLYAFGVLLEAVIEGDVFDIWGRHKMEKRISQLTNHVIVCGFGRVGRSVARHLAASDEDFVVIDQDSQRLDGTEYLTIAGDATDDEVLRQAGMERARALVAATSTDTTNVYVALSGRALRPDLFIVARARDAESEPKLLRAGANRVINPQAIGGNRVAAMLTQPHVSEFLDVVTHGDEIEFRLVEVAVGQGSSLAGRSLRDAKLRENTGALVLAIRGADGQFQTNPGPDTLISDGDVLIAIGTQAQLESLVALSQQVNPLAET
ncbi:MAG TPA: potassium channel protein [Acidimicrobiales bacterium]|nr:potassium channel protein [Acidimicrobiales bacterium]